VNCQLFDRYVFDYCDNNLSSALKMEMDKHRQECSRCNSQFMLTNLENQVLRDKSDLPVLADDFTPRVMQKIFEADHAATLHLRWTRKPFPARVRKIALTSAVAGLLVFLAIFAPHIIPFQKGPQVADTPSVGIGNSSDSDPTAMEMRSASKMAKPEETSSTINYDQMSPRSLSSEEANISPAKESAPPVTTPDNSSAADHASAELMMAVTAEPASDGSVPADSGTETADPPLGVMYWKTGEAQSPSRQGGIPDSDGKSDKVSDLPKPQQVPSSFTLTNVVNSNMDKNDPIIEYHYTDKDNRLLVITLQNVKNLDSIALMNKESQSLSEAPILAGKASQPQVEVIYNIDVGGQAYQVTLNGTLSAEELGKLAETISFSNNISATSQ